MLSLHADWGVGDDRAFRAAARNALGVAAEYDVLVTVGVKPSRNETAYGYIVPGKSLGSARAVRRFVEKPSAARAMLLRRRGALWNTGLFAWGVARFLGEAGAYARERSEEHTSELQSLAYLVCRLLLEKKKKKKRPSS